MSAIINGNTVLFKSEYSLQDIRLRHYTNGYKLIFNSDVEFKKTTEQVSVKFENMEIIKSGNKMVFKRDNQTLMVLE